MFLSKSEKENHVCTCGTCDCGVVSESKDETSEVCDDVSGSSEVDMEVDREAKSKLDIKVDKIVEKGYYILDDILCMSQDNSVYGGSFSSKDAFFCVNYLDLDYLVSYLNHIFNEFSLSSLHLVKHGHNFDLNIGLGLRSGRLGIFVEVMFTDKFMEDKDVNMNAFVSALNSCVQRSNGLIRRVVFDNRMGDLSDIDCRRPYLALRLLPRHMDVSLGETYILFFEFSSSVGVTCVDGYSSGLLDLGVYKRAGDMCVIDPLDNFFNLDMCKDGFLVGVSLNTLKKRGIRVLLSQLGVVKGSLIES